jgi:hypothetical protein
MESQGLLHYDDDSLLGHGADNDQDLMMVAADISEMSVNLYQTTGAMIIIGSDDDGSRPALLTYVTLRGAATGAISQKAVIHILVRTREPEI